MGDRYNEVLQANIAVHSKLASVYRTTEPHFRAENVAVVDACLGAVVAATNAQRLLDLGCGTGFMIDVAKKHVREIVGVDVTRAMLDEIEERRRRRALDREPIGELRDVPPGRDAV